MSKPWARRSKLALGLAVTALFVWLFARELDAGALAEAFSRLSFAAVMFALAFMAAAHAVRIVRWWVMLRALEPGLPLGACARPFLAGMAVNNVMPLRAGDALRVVGFRRQLRSPAMRVFGTLVIERALDLVVVSAIFFAALTGLPEGVLPRGVVSAAGWLACAGAAAILASICLRPLGQRLGNWAPGLSRALRFGRLRKFAPHAAQLTAALDVVRSPSRALALCVLSAVVWACEGGAFVVVAGALEAQIAAGAPWLSLAAGSLATAIPSAPGYVGTFDYFAALAFESCGATPEASAALALALHGMWIPFTVVGLLCCLPTGVFRPSRQMTAGPE